MTAIAGLIHKGKVYIAADKLTSADYLGLTVKQPKVFKINDFIFGVCGAVRCSQLICYKFKPTVDANVSLDEYLHTTFVDSLIKILEDNKSLNKENEYTFGSSFLFGYKDRLFSMHPDFSIAETVANYRALGSGSEVVLGALEGAKGSPQSILTHAINASSNHILSVGGGVDIVST